MIVIVDYGLGNLTSIKNMVKKIGGEAQVSSDPEAILNADKLILPGVGNFLRGMENLKKSGLIPILEKVALEIKKPVLGICLGMQLMTNHSEEGNINGLGWIDAETFKFTFSYDSSLKIPHMGWTPVHFLKTSLINHEIPDNPRYYFVHSYYVKCNSVKNSLAQANYGHPFDCAIVNDNIIGVQFHPEKSHKYGMELFRNFNEI
jgi:glutamine amidotransferase